MKCDKCDKEATLEIVIYSPNKAMKLSLCGDCYKKMISEGNFDFDKLENGETPIKGEMKSFQDILSELIGAVIDTSEVEDTGRRCSFCGTTFKHIAHTGKFGCDHCYREFYANVKSTLTATQGSDDHVGKVPKRFEDLQRIKGQIKDREKTLENYVKAEKYEEAASARDAINTLKAELEELRGELDG